MSQKFTFGHGSVKLQQGTTGEGNKCIMLTRQTVCRPIGSRPDKWKDQLGENEVDTIIEFKTLESARVFQDEVNGLISDWAKADALTVTVDEPI